MDSIIFQAYITWCTLLQRPQTMDVEFLPYFYIPGGIVLRHRKDGLSVQQFQPIGYPD